MKPSVRLVSRSEALSLVSEATEIYREVYSGPPYNETAENVALFQSSWERRVSREGFLMCAAFDGLGRLLGFSYGWATKVGDVWNTRIRTELTADEVAKWYVDCFELMDLAVSARAQGLGLGRSLMNELLAHARNQTALLLTHSTATRASEMYRRYGWTVLRERFQPGSPNVLTLMVKRLR